MLRCAFFGMFIIYIREISATSRGVLIAQENDMAILHCNITTPAPSNVSGRPKYIIWKKGHKDGQTVAMQNGVSRTTYRAGYSVRPEDGALMIEKVLLEDEGLYTCVGLDFGQSITLKVQVVPSNPRIIGPMVFGGRKQVEKIHCRIGRVKPRDLMSIYWTKDKVVLNDVDQTANLNVDNTWTVASVLKSRFDRRDQGRDLACNIKWKGEVFAVAQRKILLTVLPSVDVRAYPNPVDEGQKVRLFCNISNIKSVFIKYRWFQVRKERTVVFKSNSSVLSLDNASQFIEGKILCQVTFDAGMEIGYTLLVVKPRGFSMFQILYMATPSVGILLLVLAVFLCWWQRRRGRKKTRESYESTLRSTFNVRNSYAGMAIKSEISTVDPRWTSYKKPRDAHNISDDYLSPQNFTVDDQKLKGTTVNNNKAELIEHDYEFVE